MNDFSALLKIADNEVTAAMMKELLAEGVDPNTTDFSDMSTPAEEPYSQEEGEMSDQEVEELAQAIGYQGDLEALEEGIEVEQEHGPSGPEGGKYDITGDDDLTAAQIAAAHIAEHPEYYEHLEEMEEDLSSSEGDNDLSEESMPEDIPEVMQEDIAEKVSMKLAGIVQNYVEGASGRPYEGPLDTQDREKAMRAMGYYVGGGLGGITGLLKGPGLMGALGGAAFKGPIRSAMSRGMASLAGIPLGALLGSILGSRLGASTAGLAGRTMEGLGSYLGEKVPDSEISDIALGTPYDRGEDEQVKEKGYRALGALGGLSIGMLPGLKNMSPMQTLAGGALVGLPAALLGSRLVGAGSYIGDSALESAGSVIPSRSTRNTGDPFKSKIRALLDEPSY